MRVAGAGVASLQASKAVRHNHGTIQGNFFSGTGTRASMDDAGRVALLYVESWCCRSGPAVDISCPPHGWPWGPGPATAPHPYHTPRTSWQRRVILSDKCKRRAPLASAVPVGSTVGSTTHTYIQRQPTASRPTPAVGPIPHLGAPRSLVPLLQPAARLYDISAAPYKR